MTPIRNLLFFAVFGLFTNFTYSQYVTVDDTYTAAQLVQNVLINSPCAQVSNFSVSGDNYSAGAQSYGRFNRGTSSFPFADGVVLATSRAKRIEGPNDGRVDEGNADWPGDSDLQQALDVSGNFFNATVLEFDFLPLSSQFSFDYIFASEEYGGNDPCRYSDGFAFLLKKANTADPYQNLAVIPNTPNTAVSVITVHDPSTGSCQNYPQYYAGNNGFSAPIKLDGQTVPMTAIGSVEPNVLYHIKLVIADHGNPRYDSAIFLEAGSFKIETDIGADRLLSSNNPLCIGESYPLDATEPLGTSYQWFKNNIRIPAPLGTAPIYTVRSPDSARYKVEVILGSAGCVSIGEIELEYAALPVVSPAALVQCDPDNDGRSIFNLTDADAIIKNGDTTLGSVTYYPDLSNAEAGTNPITNPQNYNSSAGFIYAAVPNNYGCRGIARVQLGFSNNTVGNTTLETCDLDSDPVQDGKYDFRLSDADAAVLAGLPTGLPLTVQYYLTEEDALVYTSRILPNNYRNTTPFNQEIYAKVANGPACYGISKIQLIVQTFAPAGFEDEDLGICDFKDLAAPGGYSNYVWSHDPLNHGNISRVTAPGNYTVTVTQNLCSISKTFRVTIPEPPVITSIDVNDVSQNENSVLIHYTGNANYRFSIDGFVFQDSPYFTNVRQGNHTIIVKGECEIDSEDIFVLDYPRFFTPNNDSYNDLWSIESPEPDSNDSIHIYDQYGKFLKQLSTGGKGWDGKFNGKDLPAADYWFILTLKNGRIVKGHFSLKR